MENFIVKVKKLRDGAILPTYQTEHAAAMDAHACIDEARVLQPMERTMVPTGIAIELPIGYELQIRARSGLAIKHGISIINGIGTIDSDYRGELGVLLVNLGNEPFTIEPGMRIAQLVVARYERVEWSVVSELGDSDRGTDGLGSTGH